MIRPEHEAFAKAVVRLAREYNMRDISLSFRAGFDPLPGSLHYFDLVKMEWSPERHGVASNIHLRSEEVRDIPEESR